MALSVYALTTLAAVKAELGIADASQDAILERQINAASDLIRRFTNRVFQWEQDIVEKLAGFANPSLILSRTPILSISEIRIRDAVLDASEFQVRDSRAGIVFRIVPWPWSPLAIGNITRDPLPGTEEQNIQVTYTAGYVTPQQEIDLLLTRTLPFDLEEAAIITAVSLFQQRGSDREILSESLLSYSVTFDRSSDRLAAQLPTTVVGMLQPFVRIAQGALR